MELRRRLVSATAVVFTVGALLVGCTESEPPVDTTTYDPDITEAPDTETVIDYSAPEGDPEFVPNPIFGEKGATEVWSAEHVSLPVNGLVSASGDMWAVQRRDGETSEWTAYVYDANDPEIEVWSGPCTNRSVWFGDKLACHWDLVDPTDGSKQTLIDADIDARSWDGPVAATEDILVLQQGDELAGFNPAGEEIWRSPRHESWLDVVPGAEVASLSTNDVKRILYLSTGEIVDLPASTLNVNLVVGGYAVLSRQASDSVWEVYSNDGEEVTSGRSGEMLRCEPPAGSPQLLSDLVECPQAVDNAGGNDSAIISLARGTDGIHVVTNPDGESFFELDSDPLPIDRTGARIQMWDGETVLISMPGTDWASGQVALWNQDTNFPFLRVDASSYQLPSPDLFVAFTGEYRGISDRGTVRVFVPFGED